MRPFCWAFSVDWWIASVSAMRLYAFFAELSRDSERKPITSSGVYPKL